jgi:DNA-directed RNA polymerase alpha subunit
MNIDIKSLLDSVFANAKEEEYLQAMEHLSKSYIQVKGFGPNALMHTVQKIAKAYDTRNRLPPHVLNTQLRDLKFTTKTLYALLSGGIVTLGDLIAASPARLLQLNNFGKVALQEVNTKLAAYRGEVSK